MKYIKDPREIEKRSFEIITKELGDRKFNHREDKIIKRVIHTTADFEYADLLEIHPEAIDKGIKALKDGSYIYTDTQMIKAGINKRKLSTLGGKVCNLVHDKEVVKEAKERGVTRSMVAIEKACDNKNIKIFAIGNAPTALFQLINLIKEGKAKPELIVGVPVGFVGAKESKDALMNINVPYIITKGRKGGSTVSAAIINALLYLI
ncbi:precorrin-8X methylmutase [Thermohalobacter berrensis]|uniref:Precorrin-8X methylmutase n=1 Tax=Thermohalobacter berrensis TaxID=99594 RepID=A0A419SZF6_9FIRM|nr:precorrin-8X methylmutase [Thermohalobacter berrensis]RKD30595.1 precorrin-8X methylmutase [Thermohalobacter berrensis]